MIGPQLRFTFKSLHAAIGVVDLLVVLVFCWLVFDPGKGYDSSDTARAVKSVTIAAAFFAAGLYLEQVKNRLTHAGDPVSPTLVSLFGGVVLTRAESTDHHRAQHMALTGFAVDAAAAATLLALAVVAYGEPGELAEMAFVGSALLAGMAALRLSAVQGLNGGGLARWYLAIVFDDEDSESQALKLLSMAVSILFLASGFFMVVQQTQWNVWGLPVMAAGFDCAALTQWYSRRERWVRAASEKRVAEIGQSKLPTVRRSAPISELLSIFAVEGQRALVVVTDERGQPTGLIQLRQLRAAVHAGASSHPDEMMVTLSNIPHVDGETTVLDAALFLERTGQLAMVIESTTGKLRVVSLDELRSIVD
jgi:CBS domain-containing protein